MKTAAPSNAAIDAAVQAAVTAGASSTYRATENVEGLHAMASFAAGSASGWENGGLVGLVGLNPTALQGWI